MSKECEECHEKSDHVNQCHCCETFVCDSCAGDRCGTYDTHRLQLQRLKGVETWPKTAIQLGRDGLSDPSHPSRFGKTKAMANEAACCAQGERKQEIFCQYCDMWVCCDCLYADGSAYTCCVEVGCMVIACPGCGDRGDICTGCRGYLCEEHSEFGAQCLECASDLGENTQM